ncbi:amidohydrolase family protein [Chloroflexota bacterium]
MKIDLHAHFIPRDCFDMVGKKGHKHGLTMGKDASGQDVLMLGNMSAGSIAALCDQERRIQNMDKIGLDIQAISILPPSIFYDIDSEDGLSFCQRQNNAIAEVVRAYPDRFVGMATVPMQDMSKAVPELERAVRKLGLKAVEILSNINGKNLDEPEFWPFYQKAQDLDIPIYIHPSTGRLNAGADRMQRYFLINLIGNPLDTTLAIASIIFGGVLESFPRLRFLLSHAGGYAPFIRGRWEQGYQFIEACHSIPKPPSEYLKLMYFDTVIHFGPALAYLVDTVGADKVVLGSDYPASMGVFDPVNHVRNAAGISAASKEKILEQTSVTWLKLAV